MKQSTFRDVTTGFSTNEKYYTDLGCDTSSVWDFCARLISWRSFREEISGDVV